VCVFGNYLLTLQRLCGDSDGFLGCSIRKTIRMKKYILAIFAIPLALNLHAQNVTNSPYSQYGVGELATQSNSIGSGMNGLGIGWREHNQVNFKNPASYASIDSLSLIFDASVSAHVTNFAEGNHRVNANNSSFDHVVAGFRAAKHVGVSVGVLPYSNIGYSYYNTEKVGTPGENESVTTYTNTYSGSGGLHQVYLGVGVEPIKGFSLGANVGYLWGDYTKAIVNSYSDSYVNTLSKYYSVKVNNYKADFGAQLELNLGKQDKVVIGATYGLGHNLNATPECSVILTNSQTSVADTTVYKIEDGLSLPTTFGAGFVYNHANKYRIGFDYEMQKWGAVDFPVYCVENNKPQYSLASGQFLDAQKFTLGGEYCKNVRGRRFFDRVRYRMGASYGTPYIKINGNDGPKEISVSAGVGFPIINGWENRSMVNISGQWVHRSAQDLIKENTFRITVGITFNEQWFAKWKVN